MGRHRTETLRSIVFKEKGTNQTIGASRRAASHELSRGWVALQPTSQSPEGLSANATLCAPSGRTLTATPSPSRCSNSRRDLTASPEEGRSPKAEMTADAVAEGMGSPPTGPSSSSKMLHSLTSSTVTRHYDSADRSLC